MTRFNPLDYPIVFMPPTRDAGYQWWVGHIPFAFMVTQMVRPDVFVELGTLGGSSYCAFCQAVAELKLPTRCFGVDTFEGDEHTGRYGEEILADLRAFHDPRYGHFSQLVRSTFDDALSQFPDGSIDLLHIDGRHTYDAAKHDYETWRPKLSARGVALFHDTANRDPGYGVYKVWEEVRTTGPSFNFPHYAGLGVLAVGPQQPAEFLAFLRAANEAPAAVAGFFETVGKRIDQGFVINQLSDFLDKGQRFIDRWKSEAGQPSEDAPADAKVVPYQAARRMSRDLQALAAGDPRRKR